MATYLQTGTRIRVQRSGAVVVARLNALKSRFKLSPLEAAIYHLTVDRQQSILDVARDTGLSIRQLLAVNRDAQRKARIALTPEATREAQGVGIAL